MKIRLDGWDAGIRFVAGHFLPSIEKCSRLHGHNYAILLEIEGNTGSDGIIIDFIKIKDAAHSIVQEIDHKMLLPSMGSSMNVSRAGESFTVQFNGKKYVFPASDVVLLPLDNVSAENLSVFFARKLKESGIFGSNVSRISVGVAEGRGQEAWTTEAVR